MKEITAYKCEYCNMVSMYKGHTKRHERDHCRKSPERKCCGLCVHLDNDRKTIYNPFHGGNPGSTDYEMDCWWCKELDQDLNYHDLNGNNECECFISKVVVNTNKT